MLFHQLAVALGGLLLQLLAPGLGFLLQLLAAPGELLFHLGHAALVLLLGLGHLLAGVQQHLLALLAGLLPQFPHLALRLLADGGGTDQLLPLPAGLGHDLLGLLAGLLDEALALADQLVGLGDLQRQGLPQGIHHFDGVLLVDETATAEGDLAAVEDDLLQLIELVEHGDADLGHVRQMGMID